MNLNKQVFKTNILPILAGIWAVMFIIFMFINKNPQLDTINSYIFIGISIYVTVLTFSKAFKNKNNPILLYGALGFACLALGNIYFTLLYFVKSVPDEISVGNFSNICCYLFFLSALMGLKENKSKFKLFYTIVIIVSVIATVACAYAVVTNITLIMLISIILLDSICIIVAATLLNNKKAKFFAIMMIIVSIIDIIIDFSISYFIYVLVNAATPVLYLLLAKALMKVGENNAA